VTTFTWLHLTDMHAGQPPRGYDVQWVIARIVADIRALVDEVGDDLRPELVVFTGDLAYSGTEYQSGDASVEALLGLLWQQWPWPERPAIAPVPGNHDLMWQTFDRDQYVLWRSFHDAEPIVRDQFFARPAAAPEAPYWLFRKVSDAFAGYTQWFQHTALPRVRTDRVGRLPGEYASTFESRDGARIGLLALNSAYYDLPALHKERPKQLALHAEQLAALGFADWYQQHNACFVLTHHPPQWIHDQPRARLRQQYFLPDQIALHLCGHVHELEMARYGAGWDDGTLIYQGRSLFGVEADAAGQVQPSLGYTIGQLRFAADAPHATLRMFPRHAPLDRGQFVFQADGPVTLGHHLPEKVIQARSLRRTPPPRPAAQRPPSLKVLLDGVVERVWRTLAEPSGQSVFLSGPPRYGKTTVVGEVQTRLARGTRVAHRDLSQLPDMKRSSRADIVAFLLQGMAPLFDRPAGAFGDLGALLSARLDSARCVLVLDAYHLIAGDARHEIANELRFCMETYRPQFRLLILSRWPLAKAAPVPHTALEPSSFQTMLREVELRPIRTAEIRAWAATHAQFRDRLALVDWLQRHTGGHPWLLSTLLQQLCELGGDWPAWTGEAATDRDRRRGLHDPGGPLSDVVQQLRDGVAAIAPTRDAARKPLRSLCDAGGELIDFVATCFGAP
jgi:hypothetical protein